MDWVQLIVTVVGLTGLFFYQHYRIKALNEKAQDQSDLLSSIKTYFDIMNPEIIKLRVELYEKLLEKEKKIDGIKKEVEREMAHKAGKVAAEAVTSHILPVLENLIEALAFLPHETRKKIVEGIKEENIREALLGALPKMQEVEHRFLIEALAKTTGPGDTNNEKS